MNWLLWIPTILLASFSLVLILGNPIAAYAAKRGGYSYSFVPFVGGISGFIACWLCPWNAARCVSWLPILADWSIPAFIYVLFFTDAFRSRKNDREG